MAKSARKVDVEERIKLSKVQQEALPIIARAIDEGNSHHISLLLILRDAGIHNLTIHWLTEKGLIAKTDQNHYHLTSLGKAFLGE